MATHSIINEVQEGLYSYLITIKQAKPHIRKNTETHTHTNLQTCSCTHEQTDIQACGSVLVTYMAMHIYTHTNQDYLSYLLSMQSFLGSLLHSSTLHQSINPTLWCQGKPVHMQSDLELVTVFLLTHLHITLSFYIYYKWSRQQETLRVSFF